MSLRPFHNFMAYKNDFRAFQKHWSTDFEALKYGQMLGRVRSLFFFFFFFTGWARAWSSRRTSRPRTLGDLRPCGWRSACRAGPSPWARSSPPGRGRSRKEARCKTRCPRNRTQSARTPEAPPSRPGKKPEQNIQRCLIESLAYIFLNSRIII